MSRPSGWRAAQPRAGRPAADRVLRADGALMAARIVSCGRDVVNARGYRGTRVEDIASAAGVTRGTFYLYFRDVEDLLHRLAADAYDAFRPLAVRLAAMDPRDPAVLAPWMQEFVDAYQAHGGVMRAWLDGDDQDPLMTWAARRVVGTMVDALAVRAGGPGAPDATRGLALFAMIAELNAYLGARPDPPPPSVAAVLTRLVGGIRPRPALGAHPA